MESKLYSAFGCGNFSNDYNWDSGVPNLACSEALDGTDFKETEMFLGKYVYETDCSEYEGNREVALVVRANNLEEAQRYARLFVDYYYPEYYQEEDEDD